MTVSSKVRSSSAFFSSGRAPAFWIPVEMFSEKLRKHGVLGRKLTQRLFQIAPSFGEVNMIDEGEGQRDLCRIL